MSNFLEEEGLSYYDNKLKNYIPSVIEDNLAKGILGNETVLSTDNVPFVSKTMGAGKYQRKKFVGCSYVWNQQIVADAKSANYTWESDSSIYNYSIYQFKTADKPTLYANHVYFTSANLSRTLSTNNRISLQIGQYNKPNSIGGLQNGDPNGIVCNILKTNEDIVCNNIYANTYSGKQGFTQGDTVTYDNLFIVDLTQLFGSTAIADYIYNLETATAGAGIAKMKELGFFTEDYYAYDAGSIQSVDIKEYSVTGFNIYDGNSSVESTTRYSGYISVKPNTKYCVTKREEDINKAFFVRYCDINKTEINFTYKLTKSFTFTTPVNCCYIILMAISSIDFTSICINLNKTTGTPKNGDFEPYHKTTYPLTPTELRGVPRIDANNNIYADGDEYASDGGHKSNYMQISLANRNWTEYTYGGVQGFYTTITTTKLNANLVCTRYIRATSDAVFDSNGVDKEIFISNNLIKIKDSAYSDAAAFKEAVSDVYVVCEAKTPTTETLTPFDYPQSVGSLEEIVDYKVEQEDRDVAIPTGHVTEYMGKGGEFTLPTLPETPSVLAFDGHNAYWEENTINLVKAFMNENRRTRRNITNDLANLSQAVAEQNLGKYGYSIGDYFTGASGYTYVLADYNTFRGTTSKRISSNHLGIVVDTHATSQWHTGDASAVGYAGSVLHTYLSSTILDTIKSDFIALFGGTTGLEHLVSHSKMLTTALSNIAWQADQYISALSEVQIYGSNVWSANGYQTGEASKKLEVFNKFDYTDIFGNEFIYLRSIESGTLVCLADGNGAANHIAPSNTYYAVGLIIFA